MSRRRSGRRRAFRAPRRRSRYPLRRAAALVARSANLRRRPMPRAAIPERNWVNIQWLVRLRWAEIAGQAATVFVGQFLFDGALPIAALFGVVAVGLISNLAIELHFFGDRRASAR